MAFRHPLAGCGAPRSRGPVRPAAGIRPPSEAGRPQLSPGHGGAPGRPDLPQRGEGAAVAIWRLYFHGTQLNIAPRLERQRAVCSPSPGKGRCFPRSPRRCSQRCGGGYSPGHSRVRSARWQGGTFPIAEAASSPSPSAPAAGLRAAGVSRTPHPRWRRPRPGGAAPHPGASAERRAPGHLCQHWHFSLLPLHVLRMLERCLLDEALSDL